MADPKQRFTFGNILTIALFCIGAIVAAISFETYALDALNAHADDIQQNSVDIQANEDDIDELKEIRIDIATMQADITYIKKIIEDMNGH